MKRLKIFDLNDIVIILVALILVPYYAHAQKSRTIMLVGKVADSFTDMAIPDAKVTLMSADSTVIDSIRVFVLDTGNGFQEALFTFQNIPTTHKHYILKAEQKGYEDTYMNYEVKRVGRNTRLDLPTIAMKKKSAMEHTLGEVEVTATKVKVVHRGDTLVFNADAFNVADGSMLDGLIRQMPGVELKRDGEILVNGKKVDYMLLNGKDFYRGNNRLMLENLPYYMVQNVKVYDRTTDRAAYAGLGNERKDFVMDVNLKRQYKQGYMANAEAGGGTDETWLGRLFGLRFTDHSRLSLIGNANNVNAEYNIDNQGNDRDNDFNREGRDTRKTVSAGLQIDSKNWSNNLETSFGWTKNEAQQKAYTETLHNNDSTTYSSNISDNTNDRFKVNASNEFTLKVPFYLKSATVFSYDNKNSVSTSDYSSQPASQQFRSLADGHNLMLSQTLSSTHKLVWGDVLDLNMSFSYTNGKNNADEQRATTYQSGNEMELTVVNRPRHDYDYQFGANYSVNDFHDGTWQLQLSYNQHYNSESEDRTDRQTGAVDINSYSLGELTRKYRGALRYAYERYSDDGSKHTSLEIVAPLSRVERHSHYTQAWLDTCAIRNAWLFEPSAEFEHYWDSYDITLNASYTKEMPETRRLVNIPNTVDPLNTYLGNPVLKDPGTFKAGLKFFYNPQGQQLRIFANWAKFYNQITQSYDYDRNTVRYTFKPENISGNWRGDYTAFYSHQLGKDSPFWIAGQNKGDFGRTSNLGWHVSFINMTQYANISYDKGGTRLILDASVEWQHASSTSEDFTDVNARIYRYGFNAICRLPWKLSLDTDISMTHRRGYDASEMNGNNCSWNMTIGRCFLKGDRLTLRVTALDILHDYSSITETVTSAGRTETWHKSLPAYWMLRVSYKFSGK